MRAQVELLLLARLTRALPSAHAARGLKRLLEDSESFAFGARALPALGGCRGARGDGAARCDVVLFGGSYGGMLAAWLGTLG